MALDEDLDPEPVVVIGTDKEVSVERAREIGYYGRADYIGYRFLQRKGSGLAGAIAGLYISAWQPLLTAIGLLELALGFILERKTEMENRHIAEQLDNRERFERLKYLNMLR